MLDDVQPLVAPGLPSLGVAAPFVWGGGGRRLTPEEIAAERDRAQQLQAAGMDFSPVQSWTQGLARVAQGLVGGLEAKEARKAADANAAESQSVVRALMTADPNDPNAAESTVLGALANPYIDERTRALVGAQYARMNPKPAAPSVQRANNGDILGIDPATGQILYHIADPNPKPSLNWIQVKDPVTGALQIVPVGPNGPIMGGGDPASGAGAGQPPATLPPDFDFGDGGSNAAGRFPNIERYYGGQ